MEPYLNKTRLGVRLDSLGLKGLILFLSLAWFIWLWGLNAAALLAGAALSVMAYTLIYLGQRQRVTQREEALRRRLGGELSLEGVLLFPSRKAHFQGALWLGAGYPGLEMERATSQGVLCRYEGQRLLAALIPCHPEEKVGCAPLLALQRGVKELGADRGIALLTAAPTREAQRCAASAQPPVRLILREQLLKLAGACAPATDEQLVALGRRNRRSSEPRVWVRHILSPHRARRYLMYGLGLLALYGITRLPYYPVPGVVLLCLAALCRAYPRGQEKL